MEILAVGVVTFIIGVIAGVAFDKYLIQEVETIKEHVTGEIASTEGRIRQEIADVRSKIASKL